MNDILSLPSEIASKNNHKSKTKKKQKKAKGQKSSSEQILWSKDHAQIISEFTGKLKSAKTMSYPDLTKPYIVHCDASQKGLGAVLYQEIGGKTKVIRYAFRTLTPAEKNHHLHSGKLEFLTLKWSVTEKCPDYLYYANEFQGINDEVFH